jgi:MFS family permease
LLGGWVVNATGFGMVVPFLSLYFHQELGIPMRWVGLFFLATALIRAVAGALAGRWSDRIGRRPLLIVAPLGRGLTFFLTAYLVWHRAGFLVTAGAIFLTFFFASSYQPVAQAVVADLIEPGERLRAYAWSRVAMNLGWALGPALGGYVSQASYAALFVVGGFLAAAAAVVVALGVPETAPRGGSSVREGLRGAGSPASGSRFQVPPRFRPPVGGRVSPLGHPSFLHYALATLALYLLMAQLVATLPVFAVETVGISRAHLGHLFALNGLLVVVFQTLVTRLLSRFPIVLVQSVGSLAYAGSYFLVSQAGSFAALVALMTGITVAEMAVTPGTVTVVSHMAPPERMGSYMGVFGLFSNAAWSLGPFLGGILLDLFPSDPVKLWASVSVLGIAAAALFTTFRRRFGDLPGRVTLS